MELQSDCLCICLDVSKRALFCANLRLSLTSKTNLIIRYFNWKQDILDLLYHLSTHKFPLINVMFQHPSPNVNRDYRESFSEAGMQSLLSLKLGRIHAVYIIFDFIHGKHCWSQKSVQKCFTKYWCDDIIATASCISGSQDKEIKHPIFGKMQRMGWAKHKNQSEIMCLQLKLPNIKLIC